MSACYDVYLNAKIKEDELNNLVNILKKRILKENVAVNYSLKLARNNGLSFNNITDILSIVFSQRKVNEVKIYNNVLKIQSGFNASYGWEMIMIDTFYDMSKYLEDNSSLYFDIENEYDYLIVKDDQVIQIH